MQPYYRRIGFYSFKYCQQIFCKNVCNFNDVINFFSEESLSFAGYSNNKYDTYIHLDVFVEHVQQS